MSKDVEMRGFDGHNLLAFLALLGLLTALGRSRPEWNPRASWAGVTPHLHISTEANQEQIVREVLKGISEIGGLMKFSPLKNLKLTHEEFSKLQERISPEIMVALGSDGAADDTGKVLYPPLCTMLGSGKQNFLERLENATCVDYDEGDKNIEKIKNVLFEKWEYKDKESKITFRWDPKEYRPHAYRAKNPSIEKFSAIDGANRLAAVGFINYWCVPTKNKLSTVACKRDGKTWSTFWPIWTKKMTLGSIRALMCSQYMASIQNNKLTRDEELSLKAMGVTQVIKAHIFWDEKFRNVTWGERVF